MKYAEARAGRIFVIRLEDGDIVHEAIEKFARENYLMKKEKEDVFLVVDTTGDRHQ